jgi:hypothetical protein
MGKEFRKRKREGRDLNRKRRGENSIEERREERRRQELKGRKE